MTITDFSFVRRSPPGRRGGLFRGDPRAGSRRRRLRTEASVRVGRLATRASGSHDRLRQLWPSGVLDRVGAVVDHTIVDVVDDHRSRCRRHPRRHATASSRNGPVSATSRQLLAGLARCTSASRGEPPQELCTVGARYQMFAPQIHAADDEPGAHPATGAHRRRLGPVRRARARRHRRRHGHRSRRSVDARRSARHALDDAPPWRRQAPTSGSAPRDSLPSTGGTSPVRPARGRRCVVRPDQRGEHRCVTGSDLR